MFVCLSALPYLPTFFTLNEIEWQTTMSIDIFAVVVFKFHSETILTENVTDLVSVMAIVFQNTDTYTHAIRSHLNVNGNSIHTHTIYKLISIYLKVFFYMKFMLMRKAI